MFSAMVWWRTWMRTLEEQNSLSRYASMTLQMLSHKDEGQMKGRRGNFLFRIR